MTPPRILFTPLIAFASRRALVVPRSTSRMFDTMSTSLPPFGNPHFGLTKTLPGRNLSQAVQAVETELKKVGFGLLTTIDMKATMHKKIGVDLERPYVILGACNPKLAHKALEAMPAVGLLLPCNIVVTEDANENAVVSALSPLQLFGIVQEGSEEMQPLAQEVQELLEKVIDAL